MARIPTTLAAVAVAVAVLSGCALSPEAGPLSDEGIGTHACFDQPAGDFQFAEFLRNKADSPVMIRGFRLTENSPGVTIEEARVMTPEDYVRLAVGFAAYGWPRQDGPSVEQIRAASKSLEGAVIPSQAEAVIVYHIRAEHPGWELRGVTLRYADAFLPRTRTSSSHLKTCPLTP